MELMSYAKLYVSKGLSVIPLKPRSKEPIIQWKEFQMRTPSSEEIEKWFSEERNIAIVCGKVSSNLVVVDFDSEEKFKEWYDRIDKEYSHLRDKVLNTWIVKTGKGYHIYFRLSFEAPRTKPRLREGIDIKAEGGYVVAPPSIHPSGKRYEFIENPFNTEIQVLSREEWNEVLGSLAPESLKPREVEKSIVITFRNLNDSELMRLKELLKESWVEGQRQFLALFLSGWLAKAKIHPVSTAKLFKLIAEERGDNELEERLSTIYYSYKKSHGNIPELIELDKLIEKWRNEGVLRRNVSKAISKELEERVKGKSGVQEILEQTFGEEKALGIIREIEEILGVSSPFKDSVFELLDYDKQLYAVANLRKLVIARVRRDNDRIVYKERVAPVAPTNVTVYINPLGGVRKYEIVFEGRTLIRPLRIGPAPIEDIVARLRAEGLVYHPRLIEGVLNAIVQGYIRKGRAEIKEEIEAPGFYLVDNRIIVVRWEPKEVTRKELREALELLNELANEWYRHVVDRFSTIIKWGIIAPFNYAYKQRGKWIPWLYLYGSSYTGKTTLGEIVLSIWSLGSKYRKSGSNIDTVPRLGYVLSQHGTFPVLINEPGSAIYREDVIEVMKSAIESTIARGKYMRGGTYMDIPSLAPLIMTSNRALPRDDALLRRLLVIGFTYGERIDVEKAKEFEKDVKPRIRKLESLGYWIAKQILSNPSLLEKEPMELAKELLYRAYREVDLEVPEWIDLAYETEENIYEDIKESIRAYLVKRINDEYNKFVGRVIVEKEGGRVDYLVRSEVDFEERIKIVLEKRLVPWAIPRGDEVILTTDFAREIRSIVGDIGGLKSIAELLDWEYNKNFKVAGRKMQGIRVSLKDLIDFLVSHIEEN